jgi:CheY-like chemotaxis protein/two-component sensor histidine kinase
MVALISDALDISKISSGKMSIEKIEFSVLDELSDAAKLFYNSARKKEITLSAFYDPDMPQMIRSDYHRIKQIMNNLLNNAIKFTPNKGSIVLELLYDKERDGLTVSVKDNGIGISKEMQKNIFTPYTQEKSSTSREYGGTGLGLSISQQLSVLLGGKMELESEEGKGSRFYFTIPCNTKKGTVSSIEKEKLKGLSVLIYDSKNSNIAIDTAKRYLENFNLTLKETKRDESLKSIRKNKFDILVILKEDTVSHEEEIQEILDTGKSVILVEEGYFEEEHNWFAGKIEKVNSPLLPDDLFHAILEFISPTDKKIKETSADLEKMKGKRILVVDDNAINLKFMKEILKILHIETVLAHTGEESIEKFENAKPDMIFMDENMPGMQGGEAITLIRKMEKKNKLKSTVIIGLTGDGDKKTKEGLLSSGANDVLTKPIQLKEITDTIEKYL